MANTRECLDRWPNRFYPCVVILDGLGLAIVLIGKFSPGLVMEALGFRFDL